MRCSAALENSASHTAYLCNRCGYKWNAIENSKNRITYCPNCYKKDIEKFTQFREIKKNMLRRSKKTQKEVNWIKSQITERISFFWLDNQQLLTTILFIAGIAIMLVVSAKYFLL